MSEFKYLQYCTTSLQRNDELNPLLIKSKLFSGSDIHFFEGHEYGATVSLLTAILITFWIQIVHSKILQRIKFLTLLPERFV